MKRHTGSGSASRFGAKAQTGTEVQPHDVADDFDRKPAILVLRGRGEYVHTATFSHHVGIPQVDNVL